MRRRISFTQGINRILDANINRAKEGLRACEEITRFILNNRILSAQLKKIRHKISLAIDYLSVIKERDSAGDVGKNIYANELKRKGCHDIFFANIQRAKESVRVLEEFSKLKNPRAAIKFKKIRYELYGIEKRAAEKIAPLCHR